MKLKQLRKNRKLENSKQFWNLVRNMKRNNTQVMYAFTTKDDLRFFSEHDIEEQTAI